MKGFRGFTLVELMVVLAVAAILIALATPVGKFVRSNAVTSNTHEFAADLNLARNTAITARADVVVCRLTVVDQDTGAKDCLIENTEDDIFWEDGWAIFIDRNGDNSITNSTIGGSADVNDNGVPDSLEDDDPIVKIHDALPDGYTLSSNDRQRIQFNAIGLANGVNDTWTLCDPSNSIARAVVVAQTGRIRLAREHIDGSVLTCPES